MTRRRAEPNENQRPRARSRQSALSYWIELVGLQSVLFVVLTLVCFVILLVVTWVMF